MTVTCHLIQAGDVMDTKMVELAVKMVRLAGDGHSSEFIHEMFPGSNTTDFVGSVRCTAPDGGMFAGVALELDAINGIFTTLPVVPLDSGADSGESMLNFALFANGEIGGAATSSDLVFVNVGTSAVTPAIYFYNQMGEMIPADSVVDLMGGLEMAGDGSLAVPMGIAGRGEMTISTNGEGALVIGSVRVFGSGRLGGVLRFDIPFVGVAGVGASEPVNDAIFPARRMVGGINTGAAIRNLSSEPMTVTCMLMQGGDVMDTKMVRLAGDGHSSEFIHEMFPGSNTTDFVGSVRCTAGPTSWARCAAPPPTAECSPELHWNWMPRTGSSRPSRWCR
jgi:hypothetical protein